MCTLFLQGDVLKLNPEKHNPELPDSELRPEQITGHQISESGGSFPTPTPARVLLQMCCFSGCMDIAYILPNSWVCTLLPRSAGTQLICWVRLAGNQNWGEADDLKNSLPCIKDRPCLATFQTSNRNMHLLCLGDCSGFKLLRE